MVSRKKEHYFKNGLPVHRTSFCAFLDVLGFSQRMKKSYTNGSANSLLQQYHQIFSSRQEHFQTERLDPYFYFKSFSDNVLWAYPRYSDDMEMEFASLMWSLSTYQFQMALAGFFIRGGFAVGPLFIDDTTVYGDALLEAYRLENEVAVNPLVVLSELTCKLVDKHLKYYREGSAPQMLHVLINGEGQYFINYLYESMIELDEGYELDAASLEKHRDQVKSALHQNENDPKVLRKFHWLAAYHNYFCDSISSMPEYYEDLKIEGIFPEINLSSLSAI